MSINHLLTPSSTAHDINGRRATETLRSYRHASKIFVDGNYRLSPKYGFLFYVEFDFNPLITSVSNTAAQELGMIVKSVGLPKFSIDTKVHNAYNRKNIVQNKINYDPITIAFHDDQSDNVRNFWYDYYSFFYRDSDYADTTYDVIHKYQERPSFEWGYTPRPTASYNNNSAYQNYQYIQAIRIYSLYQKNFSEYELINPIITSFKHGDHANGENTNILEHQMTVQFETVKYQTGYTTSNTAGGYIELHYDTAPSPIAPSIGTNLIDNGQGGTTGASDVVQDLAYYNLTTAGGYVSPEPTSGALSAAAGASTVAKFVSAITSASGTNAGGFTLPVLGSLVAGVSNSNLLSQQLNAAGARLATSTVNTLSSGVISGVTQGLGPGGTQVLGLAAAAIVNPSGTLATVENMALKIATGAIQQGVSSLASQAAIELTKSISSGITGINQALAFNGASTLSGGFTIAAGDIQAGIGDLFTSSPTTQIGVFNADSIGVQLPALPALDFTSELSNPATFGLGGASGFGITAAGGSSNFGTIF